MRTFTLTVIALLQFTFLFGQIELRTPEECKAAIVFCQQKISENPDNKLAYKILATAYFRLQDQESLVKAVETWDQLIELDEDFEGAYYFRGYCKLFLDDKLGTCKDWWRSIELGYNPPKGFNRQSLSTGLKCICAEAALEDQNGEVPVAYKTEK